MKDDHTLTDDLSGLIFSELLAIRALVMYRSCGQLIDHSGRLGERLNHTSFSQWWGMSDATTMHGTYSEEWTVFGITAHFLNAAAQFEEMGVPIWDAAD